MHPRIETWLAYLDETATSVDRDRLRAHLDGCPACRALVEDARRMTAALEGDRLLAPSEAAREVALRALPSSRPAGVALPGWAAGLRERIARVVFDSIAHPREAFAGTRSAGLARRVRFESGGVELDALVEPHGDRRRLTAQVLRLRGGARPAADAPWIVTVGDRPVAEGRTDGSGELSREIAAGGEIRIRVSASPGELTLFRIPDPPVRPDR